MGTVRKSEYSRRSETITEMTLGAADSHSDRKFLASFKHNSHRRDRETVKRMERGVYVLATRARSRAQRSNKKAYYP